MNHNQAPIDPGIAIPQSAQEQLRPVTGVEFIAHLESRVPSEQRDRLRAAGEQYDAVMNALSQPSSPEAAAAAGNKYIEERAQAFDGLKGRRNGNIFTLKKDIADIDLESTIKQDALFPKADPEAISTGISNHVDVKPKTFSLGGVQLDSPGVSVGFALKELGRSVSAQIQKSALGSTKEKVDHLIDVNKNRSVDTDARVQEAFVVGSNDEATRLGEVFGRVVGNLESAFPIKARDAKIARFLTRQSGHEAYGRERNAAIYLGQLEQALRGALIRRDAVAAQYLRQHGEGEVAQVSQQALGVINTESATYIASLVGLPKNKEVLNFAVDFLRSKNLDVTIKDDRGLGNSGGSSEVRLTPEQKLQARAIEKVEEMRKEGWTDKNIKASFAQRAENGHAGSQDQLPYVTAYLKPRTSEYRENGTTTKTE